MNRSTILSASCATVFLCTLTILFYGAGDTEILENSMETRTETIIVTETAGKRSSSSDLTLHKTQNSTASSSVRGSEAAVSGDKAPSPEQSQSACNQSGGANKESQDKDLPAPAQKEPSLKIWEHIDPEVTICQRLSDKEGGRDWFRHCRVPALSSARRRMDAYVTQRMENYKGTCHDDAVQFHCLEFAARMHWCNWDLAPSPAPPPESALLNSKTCKALLTRQGVSSSHRDRDDYKDDHKIVFFYPSYSHLKMLNRSIAALQHPNHIFIIQVDAAPYSNPAFVEGILQVASGADNICVMSYGRVLYTTASQVLIVLPALAWAEQIKGWTHMVLMSAQDYPIISTEELREISWDERENMIYPVSPTLPCDDWRRNTEVLPNCFGYTWAKHNWGERPDSVGSWADDVGQKHPDSRREGRFGGLHFNQSGFGRVDWLSTYLDKKFPFMTQGGFDVAFIAHDIARFLLHDARAKMWIQYFSYMMIACEHLLPSITHFYFPTRLSERISCFMTWSPGWIENRALNMSDWQDMNRKGALFARKFSLPTSTEMLEEIDRKLRTRHKKRRRPWHLLTDAELRRRAVSMAMGAGAPKIAFLFLVTKSLPLAQVWERYFKDHEEKYSVYIHALPGEKPAQDSTVFADRLVPSQGWERGKWLMLAAELRLLINAVLDDPANQRFILISDSVAPTRPFLDLYNLVFSKYPNKSFQEITLKGWAHYRVNGALKALNISEDQFGQGSEYFCLTREDATFVGAEEKFRKAFFLCGSDEEDKQNDCHPEEHYIPTILALKNVTNVERRSLVLYHYTKKEEMNDTALQTSIFEKIRSRGDHIMFARGFHQHHQRLILDMKEEDLGY